MSEEEVFTHRTGDIRRQMCKCSVCGVVERCTPSFDFYGKDGEPLRCEECMLKHHGMKEPMGHVIQDSDGTRRPVSKEEFVEVVEADEERDRSAKFKCATCKHEGTEKNPFCKSGTATVCMDYEIHATKHEFAALEAELVESRQNVKLLKGALSKRTQCAVCGESLMMVCGVLGCKMRGQAIDPATQEG